MEKEKVLKVIDDNPLLLGYYLNDAKFHKAIQYIIH